ncbi:MAG: LiaI-LiaF-like domain-containing protein [Anaerolineales bacterium]
MSNRRSAIIPGLILILLGGWLLAQNLGVGLPGLDQLWPGFPLFFGLAFLLQFFLGGRTDDGLVFVGVAATLIGAFFFAFTLGLLHWSDMGRYWPVFVLIGGAAFLAQWVVRPSQRGLLIPALMALLVGGVALLLTLGRASPALVEQVTKLWPLALIVAGLLTLAGYFFRPSRAGDEDRR